MLKTECDLALWYGIVSKKRQKCLIQIISSVFIGKTPKNGYIIVQVVSHLSTNIGPDLSKVTDSFLYKNKIQSHVLVK